MSISLKELSRLLGLSQTTVSRALNGYPEVNEETRKRVMKAAADHQYSPNPRARGLATGRAMVIGHILPMQPGEEDRSEMVNPIIGDFLAGASESYNKRGYGVHLSFPDPGRELEQYRWLTRQRVVDGVILHGPRVHDERLRTLRELGLQFGVHGIVKYGDSDYIHVEMDNREATRLATDHVVSLGHKRIALLSGPTDLTFARHREAGFLEVMQQAGLIPNRFWMLNEEMTEGFGFDAARQLLQSPEPPTAFLTGSILVGMGVRRAVHAAGLRVPEDISIVTHDDVLSYLPNRGPNPPFTATRSSVREAGNLLAGFVIDQIETPDREIQTRMLYPELVIGASSGPAPTP